jgi:phosphoglycolate phosphatase
MSFRLLITDLDNTLYDWVKFYVPAFRAMTDALSGLLAVPVEALYDEFQELHRRYSTSEPPFAILELPSVQRCFAGLPPKEIKHKLDPALHAFNTIRKRSLKLYDSVKDTLQVLADHGICIVGHTEALAVNACYRLQKLEIDRYLRHLYALDTPLPAHPDPERPAELLPPEGYVVRVPPAERKPNPQLLIHICAREGFEVKDALYVGDSLTRDIGMAKQAGMRAAWAAYGAVQEKEAWDLLVRITHWTPEDVAREADLKRRFIGIQPDHQLGAFSDLLALAGLNRSG